MNAKLPRILKRHGLTLFLLASVYVAFYRPISLASEENAETTVMNQNGKIAVEEILCPTQAINSTQKMKNPSYLDRYPFLLECKTSYNKLNPSEITNTPDLNYNYMHPASNKTFMLRILRAIIIYYPIGANDHFEFELRWLYRSWVNMLTFEPAKWRTDLIVFMNTKITGHLSRPDFFMNQLNCSLNNKRTSPEQKPMCP
jgi:hypothetical protein